MKRLIFAAALAATSFRAAAGDWNEWRGPQRNGVVADSPALLETWPAEGPKRVWESEEKIPGGSVSGGYGSPVVAQGRVYLSVAINRRGPRPTRKLTASALDRLKQGKDALDIAVLDKLATIEDREFSGQAALDRWLDENGIQGAARKEVLRLFPDFSDVRDSVIYCLDANTGKTLWKKSFAGETAGPYGSSGTPCIANGKCYGIGHDGLVYCLDAGTGALVWQGKAGTAGEKHCSFLVADGVAVIPAGPLTAFDAGTGKVLWTQDKIAYTHSSAVPWRKEGRTFFMVGGSCVDSKTGAILWKVEGASDATPAIVGDRMVLWNGASVFLYKLSVEKGECLWNLKCPIAYGGGPILHDGYVYALNAAKATCIDAETGKVAWRQEKPGLVNYATPLLADGKIFVEGDDVALVALAASPAQWRVLARAKLDLNYCVAPALADGRIYVRTKSRLACYDLRK